MKIGVADYGMTMWDGGLFDYEQRCLDLQSVGYDGTERITPVSGEDALSRAAMLKKHGLDFATCLATTTEKSIQWTAALGKTYIWTAVNGKDFDTFCRQVNIQVAACERYGIHAAIHNHLGSLVESQEELEEFLGRCPKCKMVLDTGHLNAAGGDSLEIIDKYYNRIEVMHVKDWLESDPSQEKWFERGRFCELGAGNIDLDNHQVVKLLVKKGYDGWIFVEHDTHLQEPLEDLKISMDFLRNAGVEK